MADPTSVQVPGWETNGFITSQIIDNLTYTEWLNIFERIRCHLPVHCRLANEINDGIYDVEHSSDDSIKIRIVNAMICKVKKDVPQLYERELCQERPTLRESK